MGVEYVADPELILCQDFNTEGRFDHMCPRNTRHVRIGGRWLREQRTEAAFLGCIGQDLLRSFGIRQMRLVSPQRRERPAERRRFPCCFCSGQVHGLRGKQNCGETGEPGGKRQCGGPLGGVDGQALLPAP